MRSFVLTLVRFFILFKRFNNLQGALYLCRFPGNHKIDGKLQIKWKNSSLYFPALGVTFSKKEIQLFDGNISKMMNLVERYRVGRDNSYGLFIIANKFGKDVRIIVDDKSILFAIDEIFYEELYDFTIEREYVVLDVGMNRGIASLYFSCFDNVKHIYGYEPFAATQKLALSNLHLNKHLAHKITTNSYGWSNKNEIIKVPFSKAGFLGATTTSFFIEKNKRESALQSTCKVEVEIRSASSIVKEIMQNHHQIDLLLKLDCEGAEYEIIEDLDHHNLLKEISFVVIEWHFINKKNIIDCLKKNEFILVSPNRAEDFPVGMIYAFNKTLI